MVAVAIFAGVMAEIGQRRDRLVRLSIAHRERMDACLDRAGRICKSGATPASIEASYRRRGPAVWLDYQKVLFHTTLSDQYNQAACRPLFPMLSEFPPIDRYRDFDALARWALEVLLEAIPLIGFFMLVLTIRAAIVKGQAHPSSVMTNR